MSKKKFTLHQIQQMGQEFQQGASLVEISNRWGIPYRTLQDHKKNNFHLPNAAPPSTAEVPPFSAPPTMKISDLDIEGLLADWERAIKVFIMFVENLQKEAEAGRFERSDIMFMAESVMHFKWAIEDVRKCGYIIPDTLKTLQAQAEEGTAMVKLMQKRHDQKTA